jgi:hypothetical protein
MKFIIALIFLVSPAAAQIHVGLKGGVPLTDITETISSFTVFRNLPSRWTAGPMLEVDLPFGLGVEVDALYRRVGFERVGSGPPTEGNSVSKGGIWDFPLIAKYRFGGTLARPYVGGGWTYRSLNDLLEFSSSNGLVLVGGVRLNALVVKISPEMRYTRWASEGTQPGFRANQDQVEVLVGITF